jgi:hypothetical protein
MSPIAHCGVAFAAKRLAPRAPLGILLLAATLLDLLIFAFLLLGVERAGDRFPLNDYPWSHGLVMAVVWSLTVGAIIYPILRDRYTSLVIGLVVLSHWVLDFVAHDHDLPLLFRGSPLVGLGLEYSWSHTGALVMHWPRVVVVELGLFAGGLALYVGSRKPL